MFPRQDVGAKGSPPVQEPLRQPVYAEAEDGIVGNWVFWYPVIIMLVYYGFDIICQLTKPLQTT